MGILGLVRLPVLLFPVTDLLARMASPLASGLSQKCGALCINIDVGIQTSTPTSTCFLMRRLVSTDDLDFKL